MREQALLHKVMIAVSNIGARVFRNHVGMAYQGKALVCGREGAVNVRPGDVVVYQARRVRAGLCVGSSDLIGWRSLVVTPEMVGKRIAVFSAIECKADDGRVSDEQENFIEQVRHAGGIALVSTDVAETVSAVEQWRGN